jgi:hypothetical protein
MFTNQIRDDLLTPTPKPPKFSGDQIPSPGHSGEERVETNQIIDGHQDFHGVSVRFLRGDLSIFTSSEKGG